MNCYCLLKCHGRIKVLNIWGYNSLIDRAQALFHSFSPDPIPFRAYNQLVTKDKTVVSEMTYIDLLDLHASHHSMVADILNKLYKANYVKFILRNQNKVWSGINAIFSGLELFS